jgi:hypothetical protein
MRQGVRVFAWTGLFALASWSPLAAQGDIEPLLAQARSATARRDYPTAIEALEKALSEVRQAAPLVIDNFVLVAEPAKFYGGYVPRRNAEFRGSEDLHFYLEPKNLVYPRSSDGLYKPGFEVDFEIVDKDGHTVGKQDRFGSFQFTAKSALKDVYVNLHVTFEGAPPGVYEVRFTVRDSNSDKAATVKQAFKMI